MKPIFPTHEELEALMTFLPSFNHFAKRVFASKFLERR
ncbi:MAG: hypothetical protein JW395_3961 [Nitrospira sp.]|nr:hypothetical protein [Nitrospira sp.]